MEKDKLSNARWLHLIWQPLLGVIFICVALFVLNHFATSTILWAVGAGSLSSSVFICMTKPKSYVAKAHRIVGGYLVGMISGESMRFAFLQYYKMTGNFIGAPHYHVMGMMAAIAVGLAIVLMVLLHVEHPPAAGIALVLVIDVHDYRVLAIIFVAACVLAVIKRLLYCRLVELY
jgi:CBS domain-containing membrane protein